MNRTRKKEISLNKDSVLSLMQEIYNELVEQRSTAIRIQNKMLAMLKDPEDMTLIGPVIKEQQKIATDKAMAEQSTNIKSAVDSQKAGNHIYNAYIFNIIRLPKVYGI
jgi:hypothetical protein